MQLYYSTIIPAVFKDCVVPAAGQEDMGEKGLKMPIH